MLGQLVTHVQVPSVPQLHWPSLNMQLSVGVSHVAPVVGLELGQSLCPKQLKLPLLQAQVVSAIVPKPCTSAPAA
jgi:hypothetical protein